MGNGPGESSSNNIINYDGQKVDQASKLESCLPKGQAGIQIFSSPVNEHFLQVPRVVTNDKLFPLQYCT